jgi:hypothetical protein
MCSASDQSLPPDAEKIACGRLRLRSALSLSLRRTLARSDKVPPGRGS